MCHSMLYVLYLCIFVILACGLCFSPYINKVLICFHFLVLQEYWVLTESRIPLKPVLGGVIIVVLSFSSHEQTK